MFEYTPLCTILNKQVEKIKKENLETRKTYLEKWRKYHKYWYQVIMIKW